MKKIICMTLLLITAFSFSLLNGIKPISASAMTETESLNISAKSAILIEPKTNTVLYSLNENERLPIASMTKIMLLNLCFEKLDEGVYNLDDDITVSQNASGMGGSQVYLEANKKYKAGELIKSIIVASANDASVAMAEFLYGSEEECVNVMNQKCLQWNLNDTLFSNCTGLTKPTQYSSAKDVSVMLSKLIRHKEYFKYSKIWLDKIEHEGGKHTEITNTNKLVKFYDGCDGGKTGFTNESGFCLSATAKRGALRLVAVVINEKDSKTRFQDASNLFNYGFSNYSYKRILDNKHPLKVKVNVEKGKEKEVKIACEKNIDILSAKNEKVKIRIDFNPYKTVAPVSVGDRVGELVVYKNGVEYAKTYAVALENVDKKTYFDYVKDIATQFEIA